MSGIGTNGAYGAPVNADGVTTTPYPPGPSMWLAGQWLPVRNPMHLYAADLNQQLSSAVAFLSRKPMFQLAQFTAQPVPSGATTALGMDTETADPWNMHADGTDTSQVIVQPGCDGVWLVQGSVPFNTSASGKYYAAQIIYTPASGAAATVITGTRMQASGAHVAPHVADLISASAGDVFQLGAEQASGSSVSTLAAESSADIARFAGQSCPVLTGRWAASGTSLPGGVIVVDFAAMWNGPEAVIFTGGVQMAIPNLPTWTDVSALSSPVLNGSITGPVLFLSNVPACRTAANGSPAAIASGATAQVTGLQSTIDNWSAWSNSTSTWTCPLSGLYLLYGLAGFQAESSVYTATAQLNCTVSGSPVIYTGAPSSATAPASAVMRQVRLTAGDTVKVYASQNSGSTLAPQGATNTRFFSLWLSA